LEEHNGFLREWELTVADPRIHGTTYLQVGKHVADAQREALLPLPLESFPSYHEARLIAHCDGHIKSEWAYYAVPLEYVAWEVWAHCDGRMLGISNERMRQIAVHPR
jgi:hypothetical protein